MIKQSLLMGVSHFIESGDCMFPDDGPHWWADFESELLRFPQGKYDDQCDALSEALSFQDRISIYDAID